MRNESISVCMATYNGERFLKEKINSILSQLQDNDELIIVDDNSTDSTRLIIEGYSDRRIKKIYNERNIGVNKNFEKAIIHSQAKYIFLADQDDIWIPERIDVMLEKLQEQGTLVVSGNVVSIDSGGTPLVASFRKLDSMDSKNKAKILRRIFLGKAAYFGCAMGFSRDLCKVILPFPDFIESHDLWIVMAGIFLDGNAHCDNNVLYRRIHTNNASLQSRRTYKKILSRFIFIRQMMELRKRSLPKVQEE